MLREADTNGDGHISKEEFFSLLADQHAPDSLSFYDSRWVEVGWRCRRGQGLNGWEDGVGACARRGVTDGACG
jgi:hypothetical protein